ncbi:hypothetical protein RHMOL_Rhmol09G0142300 [Rhododendron molle]|uniref:Uncharacterized protein n=1 Tax=Rhododendron molle TaxID=49168 RepID=A0ACC0MD03_RHOML|nr:hypothetical protein RHMOL_Rhmol09G0142300 [Rhododendron molle]
MSAKTPRVVRIYVADGDATESSSDEDGPFRRRNKVKKHVTEIRFEACCENEKNRAVSKKRMPKKGEENTEKKQSENGTKYHGVRPRSRLCPSLAGTTTVTSHHRPPFCVSVTRKNKQSGSEAVGARDWLSWRRRL